MRIAQAIFFLLPLLAISQTVVADIPAKKILREPVHVQFKQVNALGKYKLFIKDQDSLYLIPSDTSYLITASQGAPHCIYFFAKSGDLSSDTVSICEYDQQNTIIEFKGMNGQKMDFKETAAPIINPGDSTTFTTTAPQVSSSFFSRNKTLLFVSIPLLALICLLGIFFFLKKKKVKT